MSTLATQSASLQTPPSKLPGRRYDRVFFLLVNLLILATVFIGFARTYFLAGVLSAPLPNRLIHIHGAAFSLWIALLVTQSALVSAHRVDIHRRLGIAGFFLAIAMVVLGLLAATNRLVEGTNPRAHNALEFYIIPVTDVLIFGTLILLAYRQRRNPAAHKRYILVATTALLTAAIVRWPISYIGGNVHRAALYSYLFVLALFVYDWWSTRKLQRPTLIAATILIATQQLRYTLAATAAWHAAAGWVRHIAS